MPLDYRRTQFLLSAPEPEQLPADLGAEVAFAGRSNAGKSSALNAITDQRSLARVSKTPGRTQAINVFPVGDRHSASVEDRHFPAAEYRLIDLPGYGYAKAPEALRRHWQRALPAYLEGRQSLRGLVVIMDIRHPLGPLDEQMLAWANAAELPVHVLLSKADKLRRGPAGNTLQRVLPAMRAICPASTAQLFSATNRQGVDAARRKLDEWLLG
ncbi:YihA family ribosome biogenesis GTP-binding protein [Spiribacter sp. 2438]|uniref:ribosome biogenesis GTP-binding protein YihA/YsxC n=1 Tax=Spiribacter sp. 2438 TaxID=2666185 RepID=UPI0012AF56AA|nr:ribosome biogenesis GTP-binding protein YihA/YsxC [Spiribacter sp. 2438]QGM22428.1 YihA family ribosome biogenesis GTP-binding protein [Spiribacter sp. 2438]